MKNYIEMKNYIQIETKGGYKVTLPIANMIVGVTKGEESKENSANIAWSHTDLFYNPVESYNTILEKIHKATE